MKTILILSTCLICIACVTTQAPQLSQPQQIEVKLKIEGVDNVRVQSETNKIVKTMEIDNPEGYLSNLSFISGDKVFIKIFAGISVSDVTNLWNDFCILENSTNIRDIDIFFNS